MGLCLVFHSLRMNSLFCAASQLPFDIVQGFANMEYALKICLCSMLCIADLNFKSHAMDNTSDPQ